MKTGLTFRPGETSLSLNITIIDDDVTEDPEHFTASLSSTEVGVQFSSPQSALITIADNDCMCPDNYINVLLVAMSLYLTVVEVGLNETVYSVGEGEGMVKLAVYKDGLLERKIKVLLSTKDGSAKGKMKTRHVHGFIVVT